MTGRNRDGRFTAGNHFGKGRPPRAVERDYLAALADCVPLDDWREVCRKALTDAKRGDARARDWLTGLLCGAEPMRLLDIAADEAAGYGSADAVALQAAMNEDLRGAARVLCAVADRLAAPTERCGHESQNG